MSVDCCSLCSKSIKNTSKIVCLKCGKYKCTCFKKDIFFDKVVSCFEYDQYSTNAIRNLKFNSYKSYGKTIAKYMIQKIISDDDLLKSDFIIPVPMTKSDVTKRGFNQAYIIARHISKQINIPVNQNIILKSKSTPNQHMLSEIDRRINLIDAFKCINPSSIKDKNILICDDVYTTGSTLNVISNIIRKHSPKKINCIVFSATQL